MAVVEMVDVSKTFGETHAIRGVSLELSEGEVLVLLGHNGAGKTVTVRLICTMSWPSSGRVRVCGFDTRKDPAAVRRRIGVCLDAPLMWPRLTGREHIHLMADAYGVPPDEARRRVDRVLDRLDFTLPHAKAVDEYSLGMKRKFGLALSLLHRPSLLIWDEPEIGLDAVSRVQLRALIAELRQEGTTVLLTTHSLDLAEQLADRIAVLSHGELSAVDTVDGLRFRRQRSVSLEDAFLELLSEHAAAGGEA